MSVLKLQTSIPVRGSLLPQSQLIAVGGGKGGVGKSFLSSSLGIFLANMGYKTILLDLDLGAANLHTCVGETMPKMGLDDFITGKFSELNHVAIATKITNLRLISGCNDSLDMANLDVHTRSKLMSAVFNLPADFVIMDLSAGTHNSTLDFFLMAQHQFVTLSPEPSSIENAYRFMKAAFYRKIQRYSLQFNLKTAVDELMANCEKHRIHSPSDLLSAILRLHPENGAALLQVMRQLQFKIILNQVRSRQDVELGHSIKTISSKYFGFPAQYAGYLDYDNAVWQSLRKKRPLLLEYPHSRLYSQILSIARELVHAQAKKAVV